MNCTICNTSANQVFEAIVLNEHNVKYYLCPNCEYIFTESPYWLEQAYNKAINLTDTGILQRNIYFSKIITVLIYFFFSKKGKFLDYAGGYGIFTRLMRDIGFNFYLNDPYCDNLLARGFECTGIEQNTFELLTAFEVFEHLNNPLQEIEKMLLLSNTIIFSTELLPNSVPKPGEWWYYGFEHGQHISFYSKHTLELIAKKYDLYFYSIAGVHIFTNKKLIPSAVKIFLKMAKYGLYVIVKKMMNSKTWDDHFRLKNNQSGK